MIDIDNFKHINDTCGHLEGDKVIIKTTEIIRANVGKEDIVARWGGDEFIIILPYASLKKATEISTCIKDSLSTASQLTASIGVTAFTEGDNINSIINRADLLLYQAKYKGKNEIACG